MTVAMSPNKLITALGHEDDALDRTIAMYAYMEAIDTEENDE